MAEQLPIQFEYKIQQTFDNFFPGANQEVVTHLQNAIEQHQEQFIFLWGSNGVGKTHLLNACCQLAHESLLTTFSYSFTDHQLPTVRLLDGLESIDLVCFDNIDTLAGNAEWELALFNFFNRHRDQDRQLIVTSSTPPNYLTIELSDLKTRLNWGLTLKLEALTDHDSLAALNFRANLLGFRLSKEVGQYLITRYARDLPSLWALLDSLDQASLAAKRKLTIPFLRQFLTSRAFESSESAVIQEPLNH